MRFAEKTVRGWGWLLVRLVALFLVVTMVFPLSTKMPGASYSGPLPPLSTAEILLKARLRQIVSVLAGEIGERNVWHNEELKAASEYIRRSFEQSGMTVVRQPFRANGITVVNLFAEIRGLSKPEELFVVGAHYDSVLGSPGANDNATGVAGILEIARLLSDRTPVRTIRFVAFVNEEPPFFKSEQMGSLVHANTLQREKARVTGMVSLETIGYYADGPNSQSFPFPLGLFYPPTGNFIGFVANTASTAFLKKNIAAFRRHTRFPSEGVAAPAWVAGIDWSDQWSFWKQGYPALMVTDTAPFRYPHYHMGTDTPEKINYDCLSRVVTGLAAVVWETAN